MADKKDLLKLEHIQKWYGCGENVTKAIEDISFSIQEGGFVGIMGASGSSKTTLLNCIATIDTVSDGNIYLAGMNVTAINEKHIAQFRRENLGFIFQDFNLLDTLTVSENIALALTINRVPVEMGIGIQFAHLTFGVLAIVVGMLLIGKVFVQKKHYTVNSNAISKAFIRNDKCFFYAQNQNGGDDLGFYYVYFSIDRAIYYREISQTF